MYSHVSLIAHMLSQAQILSYPNIPSSTTLKIIIIKPARSETSSNRDPPQTEKYARAGKA